MKLNKKFFLPTLTALTLSMPVVAFSYQHQQITLGAQSKNDLTTVNWTIHDSHYGRQEINESYQYSKYSFLSKDWAHDASVGQDIKFIKSASDNGRFIVVKKNKIETYKFDGLTLENSYSLDFDADYIAETSDSIVVASKGGFLDSFEKTSGTHKDIWSKRFSSISSVVGLATTTDENNVYVIGENGEIEKITNNGKREYMSTVNSSLAGETIKQVIGAGDGSFYATTKSGKLFFVEHTYAGVSSAIHILPFGGTEIKKMFYVNGKLRLISQDNSMSQIDLDSYGKLQINTVTMPLVGLDIVTASSMSQVINDDFYSTSNGSFYCSFDNRQQTFAPGKWFENHAPIKTIFRDKQGGYFVVAVDGQIVHLDENFNSSKAETRQETLLRWQKESQATVVLSDQINPYDFHVIRNTSGEMELTYVGSVMSMLQIDYSTDGEHFAPVVPTITRDMGIMQVKLKVRSEYDGKFDLSNQSPFYLSEVSDEINNYFLQKNTHKASIPSWLYSLVSVPAGISLIGAAIWLVHKKNLKTKIDK